MQRLVTNSTGKPYLLIALVLAAVVAPAYALLSRAPTRPTVTAFVDLQRAFNEIDRRADAQAQLKELEVQLDDRVEALKQEAEILLSDLKDLYTPGTDKWEEAKQKAFAAAADHRAWAQYKVLKLDAKTADRRARIYDEIALASIEFAEANNIDFIVTDDSMLELRPGTDVQVVQQMSLRRVLYANPEFDITDELITWFNAN